MNRTSLLLATSLLTLSACTFGGSPTDQTNSSASSESSSTSSLEETQNVLYTGTVEKQGVSIFMEGTHRLRLEDGRFILLESETVDLGSYIGQKVEVFGAVRPTVEHGGLIMRVTRVTSLEASSSSSAVTDTIFCGGIAAFPCPDGMQCVDDPEDSCDPNNGGADCGGICVPASSSSVSSVSSIASSKSSVTVSSVAAVSSVSSIAATSSIASTPSSSDWQGSADLTAKAAVMAKDNLAPENWTRQYCSSNIGYCFPVHKNWWFKSFGATSTTFWHVEVGPSEMFNLGEGPLTVDLLSGNAASDGAVTVSGNSVTGVRIWTGGRHIEIRGPANLEAAIRYITEQLKPSGN
jgi:hypothetical protein